MEVHHHSHLASGETHASRKKWTHYFWKFFMLFLAVSAGFLVENQREHYVEHQRAKIYAANLYGDKEFTGWLKFEASIYLEHNKNFLLPIKDTATALIALLEKEYHLK